ncbi:MAG: ParB/RepB/Spo0J family partition protein, partial [Bacteriovoracaceae bacterium]|nr:ParB/RepB/Spo0J family partition protein [Bacteriovoracaceae bacterium]
ERQKLIMSIVENIQRSNFNCVEEALAYYKLMDEYKLTQEEVAKKVGKDRSTITNFLRILKLPREVLAYLQKEELSFGHAKVLASLKDENQIKNLAKECVEAKWSVRDLEKNIETPKHKNKKSKVHNELDFLKQNLEKKTGFHFAVTKNNKDQGSFVIKFSGKEEFNHIYNFFMER